MGTAIVSLTRQPIMIQQTKTQGKTNLTEDIFDSPEYYRQFPNVTVDDVLFSLDRAESGAKVNNSVFRKRLRDRYGV